MEYAATVQGTFTVETDCWPLPFSYWLTEHSVYTKETHQMMFNLGMSSPCPASYAIICKYKVSFLREYDVKFLLYIVHHLIIAWLWWWGFTYKAYDQVRV